MQSTRIFWISACLLLFSSAVNAQTPMVAGLSGAGHAGIAKESLFLNPGALGLLKENAAFAAYTISKVEDFNSKGKVQAAGIYDGTSQYVHGGLAYIRESRRRSFGYGSPFVDQTTVRAALGRAVYENLQVGVAGNYTVDRRGTPTSKSEYFYGSFGMVYPVLSDLPVGITVDNITDQTLERPRTVFVGVNIDYHGPLNFYLDLGRVFSNRLSGSLIWMIAMELRIFPELVMRGSIFRDPINATRGYGLGLSWFGPRTAFEYGLRMTKYDPQELEHVFGLNIGF